MYVEYRSNNSGGKWWLSDQDWKALEDAGWKVEWAHLETLFTDEGKYVREADGTPRLVPVGQGNNKFGPLSSKDDSGVYRYLGALAKGAYRFGLNLRDAADEWERVTGKSATDAGCACCGQPHDFTEYDNSGKMVARGPTTEHVAHW